MVFCDFEKLEVISMATFAITPQFASMLNAAGLLSPGWHIEEDNVNGFRLYPPDGVEGKEARHAFATLFTMCFKPIGSRWVNGKKKTIFEAKF